MISPKQKARLVWQCRRGMLELDIILSRYLQQAEPLSEEQALPLEKLLQHSDPEIYSWLMGTGQPDDQDLLQVIRDIQLHSAV